MHKILNTKIKKIWAIWLTAFLLFTLLLAIILAFTIRHKESSNVFFGLAALTLSIIIFVYANSKKNSFRDAKGNAKVLSEEIIISYFPKGYKIQANSSELVNKKRYYYVGSLSIITTVINVLVSLSFFWT